MAYTVQAVIDQARGLHPAFDRFQSLQKDALDFVGRYSRTLAAEIVKRNTSSFAKETCEVDIPSFDHDDGKTLADFLYPIGGTAVYTNGDRGPFHIVPWEQRLFPEDFPSGYMHGKCLHLTQSPLEWSDVETVLFDYIPLPTKPTTLTNDETATPPGTTANVDLPDESETAVVNALGHYFALRAKATPGGKQINVATYRDERDIEEEKFLQTISHRQTAEVSKVREVW